VCFIDELKIFDILIYYYYNITEIYN